VFYTGPDKFVVNGKKIVKSPATTEMYKTKAPHTLLPPSPVLSRWRNWLKDIVYYAEYFEILYSGVHKFEGGGSCTAIHI
jgi:hypothetical protein